MKLVVNRHDEQQLQVRMTHRLSRAEVVNILAAYAEGTALSDVELDTWQASRIIHDGLRYRDTRLVSRLTPKPEYAAWADGEVTRLWPTW